MAQTFKRPSGSAIAAIVVATFAIIYVVVGTLSSGELTKLPDPLLPEVERPLKTIVLSTVSESNQLGLSRQIHTFDERRVFTVGEGDLDLETVNVIVIQMPSFETYPELPWQDLLGGVYRRLADEVQTLPTVNYEIMVNNTRKVQMVFYNMGAAGDVTPECLARHLGGIFAPEVQGAVQTFSDCAATP